MSAIRVGDFQQVTQSFYEAAAMPELWPKALHELAQACGAEGTAAHASDGLNTHRTVVSEGAAGLYHDFVTYWRAPDRNSHRARGLDLIKNGWRGALTERDCFRPEELAKDPFHQEFIIPTGFGPFAGIILAKAPGLMLSASIYRLRSQEPFDRAEIALINQLAAHLSAASEMAIRLGLRSVQTMVETFSKAGHPIAGIGADERIVYMNERFERLLGADLMLRDGQLTSWESDAAQALRIAVSKAVKFDGPLSSALAPVVLPRRTEAPVIARIAPVVGVANDLLRPVVALVMLADVAASDGGPDTTVLQNAFGLTAAEARLAGHLAQGRSLTEIARIERVTRETARDRLKTVFKKTQTGRQQELALLLSRLRTPSS